MIACLPLTALIAGPARFHALRLTSVSGISSSRLERVFPRRGFAGGQCWDDFSGFDCEVVESTGVLQHLGNMGTEPRDDYEAKKKANFNLNAGRALEVIRRQLPMVFMVSDLDFSVFAQQITVSDGNNNRLVLQRQLYAGIVKSLRLASSFSFVYPSMTVKKIEYVSSCTTIQCLVDVVLPDSIRIDGQVSIV